MQKSTCGIELSAGREGITCCQETRYMLRILGAEVIMPTKCYDENKSVHESCANENSE